jgi:hypothetical protein
MNKKPSSRILYFVSAAFIISFGCSEDSTIQPLPTGNQKPLSTFSEIERKVFATTCALPDCHNAVTAQANMVLAQGQAYNNLVNVQSFLYPQFKRVLPGNSSQSLIIKALRGEAPFTLQSKMPLGGSLDPAIIDTIAKWIDSGALNN